MIIAISVFVTCYVAIATERFPRQAIALLGAAALILVGIFPIQEALSFVDWETIGLLFGMFILIVSLAESGFFDWLASDLAEKLSYRPTYVFIAFPLLAAAMAAFMDSVTVVLFLSALSVRLARICKIDPIPLVTAEVCAANAGGAATLIGNPPNVILGTMLGFSFNDFIINLGPIALISTLVIVCGFYFLNRTMLARAEQDLHLEDLASIRMDGQITNPQLLRWGLIGFGAAIFLLITKDYISSQTGLGITTATAAIIPALFVMIVGGKETEHIVRKIDIESLLFFMGLFIITGALEKTRLIAALAQQIFALGRGNPFGLVMLLHWGSGFTSAIVDNIPMALAMAYVMKDMAGFIGATGFSLMVWSLAIGLEVGGNITPIGASANVVAYSYMEHFHGRIGWWNWIKMAAPPTLAAMLVTSAILFLKFITGWY
jgi:Na+/H+ antiporter NhaD/arsenite permease-like protein